jgi:hypothetical protein
MARESSNQALRAEQIGLQRPGCKLLFPDSRGELRDPRCRQLAARPVSPARDAALIPVAYETQLRRSSVVALNLDQVRWEADGTATVLVERSKEDQEGEGLERAWPGRT